MRILFSSFSVGIFSELRQVLRISFYNFGNEKKFKEIIVFKRKLIADLL
jgi:hypothetical protein